MAASAPLQRTHRRGSCAQGTAGSRCRGLAAFDIACRHCHERIWPAVQLPASACAAVPHRGSQHVKRQSTTQQQQDPPDTLDQGSEGDEGLGLSHSVWGSFRHGPAGLPATPSPTLVNAHDKNRLKPELRAELARRLRREAPELGVFTGRVRVLRLFRHAVDDLRLFKAIHAAGMEGRLVVVDDPDGADVVLATRKTRTGRETGTQNARNLAAKLGLPYVEVERVSGFQLMTALAPLLGLDVPTHLPKPRSPARPRELPTPLEAARIAQALGTEGDGDAAACTMTVGELLSGAAGAQLRQPGGAAPTSWSLEAEVLHHADVADPRYDMLPANPTARLGTRHALHRPIKHGRRLKLRRAQKRAASLRNDDDDDDASNDYGFTNADSRL